MSEGPVGGRAAANPSPAHALGQAPAQALRRSLLSSSPQGCGTGPLSTTSLRMKNVNHREITRREGGTLAWLPVHLLSFTTASWAASTDSSTQGPGRPHSSKVTHRPLPTCSQHLAYKATGYTQRGSPETPPSSTKRLPRSASSSLVWGY